MRKPAASKLLASKNANDILFPQPLPFSCNGRDFEILPMPDSKLIRVGIALSEMATVIGGIAELLDSGVSSLSMVSYLPHLLQTLIPCSTKLATIALDVDEEFAANIPLAKRIELLRLIFVAEDTPLLIKNFQELTAIFRTTTPATPPTPEKPEADPTTTSV